jgi:DNA-binding response OmpR family regulator
MDDYLTKPIDPALLYAAMDTYAGKPPAAAQMPAGGER